MKADPRSTGRDGGRDGGRGGEGGDGRDREGGGGRDAGRGALVDPVTINGPSRPAGRTSIRRTNLGLVLRLLRDAGPRSRARIAADTGLPRPTVTGLVTELIELGLAREGDAQRDGSVGRPGQSVRIDGRRLCGIGLEINVDYLAAVALTLGGDTVFERRVAMDVRTAGPDAVLDGAAGLLREALAALDAAGVATAGITIAAPGVVDISSGTVVYAANIGWHDVDAVSGIRTRLGRGAPQLRLENDAKLGAVAEYLEASAAGIHDLVYVTGETGVGGGIISGGRLHRGAAGFAGEIGHMPLDPGGALCACGRRGCWETMVGLAALLRHAAAPEDPVHDPSLDLESRLADLQERAAAGDPRTLEALDKVAAGLGLGLALLADVLNPRAVVLGGYFTYFGAYLAPRVERLMAERVMAPDTGGCRLLLSALGFTAPARGGALLALDPVYEDPSHAVPAAAGH
ncbi:ROK family transcriptional regulator [Streptomyces sp. NBC_00503]|uniref:ROK family transcriptional regulator n=1 Tax=Streptomyces sp. NBC_00503 TaxID=2903659 RepID=UPI002E8052C7|nr:ROK family transcriptional regulator [Streptomyces sp. NBC_00503]WUD79291.1 ROK family protein [Streptomyces sp. NBC_00503]